MRRLIVLLTVRRDELATFRRYETAAAAILKRHGCAIEHAYELATEGDTLREVHVVAFPDDAALEAYRRDPELLALAPQRERAVVATEIWSAEKLHDY